MLAHCGAKQLEYKKISYFCSELRKKTFVKMFTWAFVTPRNKDMHTIK